MASVQTRYIHDEPGKLFDKTVLLLQDVISEVFWDQLLGFPSCLVYTSGPWLQSQDFVFPPSVSSSNTFAKCPAVAAGNASTLMGLLQSQKSEKSQFCGFEGISQLRSDRPQRFRDLGLVSVGVDQSQPLRGFQLCLSKAGYGSIVQQERGTPVAAFSFGK